MAILVRNDKVCYDITLFPVLKCANTDEQQHIYNGVPKPFSFVHMFHLISRKCLLYDLLPRELDEDSFKLAKIKTSIRKASGCLTVFKSLTCIEFYIHM